MPTSTINTPGPLLQSSPGVFLWPAPPSPRPRRRLSIEVWAMLPRLPPLQLPMASPNNPSPFASIDAKLILATVSAATGMLSLGIALAIALMTTLSSGLKEMRKENAANLMALRAVNAAGLRELRGEVAANNRSVNSRLDGLYEAPDAANPSLP